MSKYITGDDLPVDFWLELEAAGIQVSNNAGAIIVEGYLGDLIDVLTNWSTEPEAWWF
jgi:hypothetical protein